MHIYIYNYTPTYTQVLEELNLATFHGAVTVLNFKSYGILLGREMVNINNK